jgi:hypothetical protein
MQPKLLASSAPAYTLKEKRLYLKSCRVIPKCDLMALLESLFLILNLLTQVTGASGLKIEVLTPIEKSELSSAKSLNTRIKIYDDASLRIQQSLQETIKNEQFETVPDLLIAWGSLLQTSISAIETDSKANKKSKQLRKFEIHLRKTIKDLPGLKLKTPYEQHDAFDACIAKTETIRKKMIDILFKN